MKAMAAIADAVSAGEITLGEASEMVKLVEGFVRSFEVYDLNARVRILEAERSNFKEALKEDLSASQERQHDAAAKTSH